MSDKKKEVTLRFNSSDYTKVKEEADGIDMPIATYCKSIILKSISGQKANP